MKTFALAGLGAFMVMGAAASANAAPLSGADLKSTITRDGSGVEQTHWRPWPHCHRRCVWRHGHRSCWRQCHGGHGGHHGHHNRLHRY